MRAQKINRRKAGASTAWVPSPTAATLHALHYHQVDVAAVQDALANRPKTGLAPLLQPPLAAGLNWSADEVTEERENNMQGILGRSEEHTSELQSLMRISYAVFCLKKKNESIKQLLNTAPIK